MKEDQKPTNGTSRWKKGGTRYTGEQRKALGKYNERTGFRNGARVHKK